MKTFFGYVGLFGVLIGLIAIGEIPAVHAFSNWINTHRSEFGPVMLGATCLGFIIMIWGWSILGIRDARPMTPSEAKDFMGKPLRLPGTQSFGRGRFKGAAQGVQTDQPVEWSFREMKKAWHAGIWWRDSVMRRRFLITAGGMTTILSGFTALMTLFKPPSAKLLMAGAGMYAVVRLIAGFWRA